jgi:phosphatidylglycerol---prolipoprotein diacylglyceryl transferase
MRWRGPGPRHRASMHPYFEIFGVTLHAESTFVQLAVVVTVALAVHWGRTREGLPPGRVVRALVVLAVLALTGARLHYMLNHPGVYSGRWHEALALWQGPFHLPGAIIALVLSTPLVCRWSGISAAKFADALAPAAGVGIALARTGCLLQGCCYGAPCTHGWCITFPPGSPPYDMQQRLGGLASDALASYPIHPLQLYFLAVGLGITALSLWLLPRKRYDGQVVAIALVVFSGTSAALELVRSDDFPRAYWGPLPQLLWTGMAMTLCSMIALVMAERSHRRVNVAARA